jgi:hypothetical protein
MVALGSYANMGTSGTCTGSIAIGYGSNTGNGFANSVAIVPGSTSTSTAACTAANQFALGDSRTASYISTIFLGRGAVAVTTAQAVSMSLTPTTGTDKAGGKFTIEAGNGTGTGGSGFITLQTAVPSTTGSTANTMVDRLKLSNGVMVGKAFNMDYGVVPVEQFYALNSNYAGANVNTTQSLFGVGVNLAANTTYEFEMVFVLLKTGGTTSHTISLLFDIGSGTISSINYLNIAQFVANPTTGISAPDIMQYIQTATATAISGATTTAAVNYQARINGVISVGTAGKWTPQYRLSAAPGGAYSTLAGSFVKIYPIGAAGANVNTGGWS